MTFFYYGGIPRDRAGPAAHPGHSKACYRVEPSGNQMTSGFRGRHGITRKLLQRVRSELQLWLWTERMKMSVRTRLDPAPDFQNTGCTALWHSLWLLLEVHHQGQAHTAYT